LDAVEGDEQAELIQHCFELTARTTDLEQAAKYMEEISLWAFRILDPWHAPFGADAQDIGEEYFFLVSV